MTSPYIRSLPLRWSVSLVVCAACLTATWFASAYAQGELHKTSLVTRWGASVTAANAWTEYPRPQLQRDTWQNLNGLWDYAITPIDEHATPTTWGGNILVPFALESKLGGVQRLLQPNEALWYRRSFDLSTGTGKRTLLNFEAVDYRCEVWVNGTAVGSHRGGNTPFSLDITQAAHVGQNELVVRVEDETEGYQLRGKQVLKPKGIWYTRVSGIWQTVWLEQVPARYIEDLHLATDAAKGSITIAADIDGAPEGLTLRATVKDGEQSVGSAEGSPTGITIAMANAKLWSPDMPHLYTLSIELVDGEGEVFDAVASYAGIRTLGKVRDKDGHWRFTLNGQPIFYWGTLDQGWWPDGLLTPPSDAAMLSDIEFLKAAGFNMIRKHIKVEPRRYYYQCDRLGMALWQDQPSAGHGPMWTMLMPNPKDAEWPDQEHQQYMAELEAMIDNLEDQPSIVVWVPFNEAWGQHHTLEVGGWLQARDPSRHVNIASGGNFFPVGDIVDYHCYPHPAFPAIPESYNDFVKVIGEFGGHGFPVAEHLWNKEKGNWGYGKLPKTSEELKARYRKSLEHLAELASKGICAGVYTQTTDVEVEVNGLLTYDREIIKIPAAELAALRKELLPK